MRRTRRWAKAHVWTHTEHLHELGAQRVKTPTAPANVFADALGKAMNHAGSIDAIYTLLELVEATEARVKKIMEDQA